jgi:hypothetical protein
LINAAQRWAKILFFGGKKIICFYIFRNRDIIKTGSVPGFNAKDWSNLVLIKEFI